MTFFRPDHAHLPRPSLPFVALVPLLALAASCSDSPTETPVDPGTSCDAVQPEAAAAHPLSAVTVAGIGEEFGEMPAGWVTDGERIVPFTLHPDPEESTATFTLPVHPGGSVAGGEAEIVFVSEDGELECSGHPFMVAPMDPAEGELDRFVSAFQDGIEDLIESYGYDPEGVLESDPEELDPLLVPVAAVHRILGSPDHEANLQAVLGEGEVGAVEAAMARAGLADHAEAFFAALQAANGSVENAAAAGDADAGAPSTVAGSAGAPSAELADALALPEPATAGLFDVVEPAYLSALMAQRASLESSSVPTQGVEHVDVYTAMLSLSTAVFGAAASLQAAGAATASFSAIMNLMTRTLPELLPSEFHDLRLTAAPTEFNEDSEEVGAWTLEMEVRSRGTTLNTVLLAYHPPFDHMLGVFRDDLVVEMMLEVSEAFTQTLGAIGVSVLGFPTEDGLQFPPVTWMVLADTGRDDESEYFDWHLEHLESWDGSPAFEFDPDPPGGGGPESAFRPLAEGSSRLEVGPVLERFPFFPPVEPEASAELVVHPITIHLDKSVVTIDIEEAEPDDFEVDVSAQVEFADDETLEWREEEGFGFFDVHDELGHTITYHVPEEVGVYVITAEAITDTGPRHDLTPPRTESVTIRVVEGGTGLMVFPDPACVAVDTPVQFMAFLDETELPIEALGWELEGPGSISEDGVFSSEEEGSVTVTFEYHDPDTDQVHTYAVSFFVLESCGELSVQSSQFAYETECVSAETITFLPHPWSTVSAAGWSSEGGAHFILGAETDIREAGSWERTFDRADAPGATGTETYWSIPTFLDASGDEWMELDEQPEAGEEVLELQRTEIQVDGETVALFSGTFQMRMYNESEAERLDLPRDEWTEATVTGEFSGVLYSDGIWLCP